MEAVFLFRSSTILPLNNQLSRYPLYFGTAPIGANENFTNLIKSFFYVLYSIFYFLHTFVFHNILIQ